MVEESTDSNSNSQERSLLVTDLGDQNQRLGKQLAEAEEAALDLRAQVLVYVRTVLEKTVRELAKQLSVKIKN